MPTNKWLLPLQSLLLIAYALCCHFAVTLYEPRLQLLALTLLCAGLVFRGLLTRSPFSWILVLGLAGTMLTIFWLGHVRYLLYIPPIALPGLLLIVFGRSLMPEQTPIITAAAKALRGDLPNTLVSYTRTITALWTALFASLVVGSALLTLFATATVWSLFTNFLNYMFIAVFFIAEFIYRQWRFPNLEHTSFRQYLHNVIHLGAARPQAIEP